MSIIPENQNIFVIDVEYIVPMEEVEPHVEAHLEYLDPFYGKNMFLASGPKVPRTGGVILAVADTKEEIEEMIAGDPFSQHKLAKFTVTEFHPRMKADGL